MVENPSKENDRNLYVPTEPDPLNGAAKEFFGVPYLFPYQRLVVSNILEAAEARGVPIRWPGTDPAYAPRPHKTQDSREGVDALEGEDRENRGRQIVILPTGAGKSLCFQLPAMLFTGPTLVIYPILALMADQERRLRERGWDPVLLRGGQSPEERQALWKRLHTGQSRFIIANPEVLLTASVLENLKGLGIVHVVIDEAHCISAWGEQFRPSYLEIAKILNAARGSVVPLVTAFTATASASVLEKIEQILFGSLGAHRIIGNPDRSNIYYSAQGCILRDLAVRDLLIKHPKPALVFCSSRPGTQQLARYLRNAWAGQGLAAQDIRFYHAGLSREEKTAGEGWFFTHPQGILIATCAYGMGVDKGDIRTVIHRDCPPSVEAYLQESGRAGRDGGPSQAILLWGPDDAGALKRAPSEASRNRLSPLLSYARNTHACRREALLRLLNYEGARQGLPSACCDVCAGRALNTLREERSLIGFFKNHRRRYTLIEAAQVLSQAAALGWSPEEAKQGITNLITRHTLRHITHPLWKNKIDVCG
ncbi:MAG: RecQ family ATP-dependent DNA helicase [Treponema sp.]|jgi:ATP-dependent DNA helicase RecQ|nr:RecQ family ATP-dependent DNA helicase [Treponema sp.]